MFRPSPYQRIAGRLNFDDAIIAASVHNDLLPPRPEDKVGGELGNRFSAYLVRELESGRYDPTPAHIIPVPKSQLATRPAALMSLRDRVVYEAIVAVLRPRIASYLLGEGIVFWPRADGARHGRWSTFERSVLEHGSEYVVSCDIAGFYESIDHGQLASAIIAATGYRDLADALVHLLDRLMGGTRGLPQGLVPSDTLATVYLADLDRAMIRDGFLYFRHGDDIRMAANSYDHGCSATRCIERQLRKRGLLLNGAKTRVFRRKTYRKSLLSHQREWEKTKTAFIDETVLELRDDEAALGEALDRFELEETGWALFYHGLIDVDEAIEKLRTKMTSEDAVVAEKLFTSILESQPKNGTGNSSRLEREVFHWQLKNILYALAAAESDAALMSVGELIREYPDKVEILCKYVMKLQGSEDCIATQLESALGEYTMEWEFAWILRVLSGVSEYLSSDLVERLKEIVDSPRGQWMLAVETAKCLAASGELRIESLRLLWNTCPEVFRVDLAVAAVRMERFAEWAKAFVESTQGDRVTEVVIHHERQRLG